MWFSLLTRFHFNGKASIEVYLIFLFVSSEQIKVNNAFKPDPKPTSNTFISFNSVLNFKPLEIKTYKDSWIAPCVEWYVSLNSGTNIVFEPSRVLIICFFKISMIYYYSNITCKIVYLRTAGNI